MVQPKGPAHSLLWAENLEEVDREIARLATICQVRILEPGVIRRALQNDTSVCGTQNPVGFKKLHDLLKLHLAIREKTVRNLGEQLTERLEEEIIARLAKTYPDLAAPWPPAPGA